jgi:hypothetical protein
MLSNVAFMQRMAHWCSQVWVKPELRDDGKLYWAADSDSQLTKGLAALLVLGLSGCSPQEILQLDVSWARTRQISHSRTLSPCYNAWAGWLDCERLGSTVTDLSCVGGTTGWWRACTLEPSLIGCSNAAWVRL